MSADLTDLILVGDLRARVAQIDARRHMQERVGHDLGGQNHFGCSTWLWAYVHNSELRVTVNGDELGVYSADVLVPMDQPTNLQELGEAAWAEAVVEGSAGTAFDFSDPNREGVRPVWSLHRDRPNMVTFAFDRAGAGNEVYIFHVDWRSPSTWSPVHRFTPGPGQLTESYELNLPPEPVVAAFSAAPPAGSADDAAPPADMTGATVVDGGSQNSLLTRVADLERQVAALQAGSGASASPSTPAGALTPSDPADAVVVSGKSGTVDLPRWYSNVTADIKVHGAELRISLNGVTTGTYYGNAQVQLTPDLLPGQSNTVVFTFDRSGPGNRVTLQGQVAGGYDSMEHVFEPSADGLTCIFLVRLAPGETKKP